MTEIKLTSDELRLMSLFQSITSATARDCIVDEKMDRVIFVVNKGQMGLAIGKGGSTIKQLQNVVARKVELVEFLNVRGRDLVAKPTDIGPFMLSFCVNDITRLSELFKQKNVSVICPPMDIEIPPNGRTKVMTVRDPGGFMLEFAQS